MNIFHKSRKIQKNADGLSTWSLANTPENSAWEPQDENHIEGICVTDIGKEFFNQVKERYMMDNSCNIVCQISMKHLKDPSLSSKPDELWKKEYDEGRLYLLK
ncbi:hypothetical protein O181_115327 [Austropuccinia psidii MF-1]|uniref:Uncharacterized protein n=1 Tax=Austropuccinia psidii MF-1 TaxID=1389203 RepID=A0A9Q3K9B5_9BASI|nr:hypothetical protein [Austropuccinia psidii MF-1]